MRFYTLSVNILWLLLFVLFPAYTLSAQNEENGKPKGDLLSPYDAIYTYQYYMHRNHYNEARAAQVFYTKSKKGRELAIQLKQVLDGKGLKLRLSMVPEANDYIDSVSKKHVYLPFPKEFPEIYLERSKESLRWQFSHETEREIPSLHKEVFPLGSDILLNLLPKMGQQPFLGMAVWQYLAILILVAIGFLLHFISSRIFSFIIHLIANSRLGKDHFDKQLVKRMGRILSYLLVFYLVYVLVPVLQLPTGLGYWILLLLRIGNSVLVIMLGLRAVSFVRSYMESVAEKTKANTDEHFMQITVRIVNAVIVVGGVIHILSIFHVNVTALIAGLSIGGLAIALAAQETVKNLIGSMMIYADRPFKIGDVVTVGAVSGTIEDIGFRSTRIRTFDTSLISVPNGNLMNETIDNLGERKQRRFRTIINVAYHTPPELMESFIEGLREIVLIHPDTDKEKIHIHLNSLSPSSLDIIFVIFFNTNDWAIELKLKEEIIFAVIRLAKALGVQFAYPTSSLHIESLPEKSGISNYRDEIAGAHGRLKDYLDSFKQKYTKPSHDGEDLEASDDD